MSELSTARATFARHVRVAEIMGTVFSVHLITAGGLLDAGAEAAIDACFADLRDIDRVFSPYRADSDVSRMARGELDLAAADPRVREVHRACLEAERTTRGLFSAHREGRFDPTGYVKGWSVEGAARRHLSPLLARGDDSVAVGINAGGDMQLFTAPGSDWTWTIGIADPRRPGEVVAHLEIIDGAVATSGSAERGRHIYDPRTGGPAVGVASASVVDAGLTKADLWATAAVVSGFLDRSWIGHADTPTGILIADDGRTARWVGTTEIDVVPTTSPDVLAPVRTH